MVYGYCRISSSTQNIDRQVRNIKELYPDALIIKEAYTGTKIERPEWQKLYKQAKKKSEKEEVTIVFDSVSRMSRNAKDGFELYEELYEEGINLVFIKEPHINTQTYKDALQKKVPTTGSSVDLILNGINEFFKELAKEQIRLAFEQAQKEVDDLHKRTKEGLETAKLNGKTIGRKKGTSIITKKEQQVSEYIMMYSSMFDGSLSDKEVIALIKGKGISVEIKAYQRYKNKLKLQNANKLASVKQSKQNKMDLIITENSVHFKGRMSNTKVREVLAANDIRVGYSTLSKRIQELKES